MNLLQLAQQIGLNPIKTSETHGGEYKSACPQCGGKDRFSIQPNRPQRNCTGFFACRRCGIGGDAIKFAREFLKMSFREAVETLQLNIDLSFDFVPKKRGPEMVIRPTVGEFISQKIDEAVAPKIAQKENAPPILVQQSEIPSTENLWRQRATTFALDCLVAIKKQPEIIEKLTKRGIPFDAIDRYRIGYNENDRYIERSEWSVPESAGKKLWIPAGIVIPSVNTVDEVIRLKIRRTNWQPTDKIGKYIAISGSKSGLTVLGNTRYQQMIVVESELDAYALNYVSRDLAFVVAVGSNIKNPDPIVSSYARKKHLYICADNDDGGRAMWQKWKAAFTHAQLLSPPTGKDIGESIEAGLNVRAWLLEHKWLDHEDHKLIKWIIDYIQERTVTKPMYAKFEREILFGPTGKRALSGELQRGFRLMKKLIEKELKAQRRNPWANNKKRPV